MRSPESAKKKMFTKISIRRPKLKYLIFYLLIIDFCQSCIKAKKEIFSSDDDKRINYIKVIKFKKIQSYIQSYLMDRKCELSMEQLCGQYRPPFLSIQVNNYEIVVNFFHIN